LIEILENWAILSDQKKYKKNDLVWVTFYRQECSQKHRKYPGFYHGTTRYGLLHFVNAKKQNKIGAGWIVELDQILARGKHEIVEIENNE
jgi:hypothetical protein